MKKCFFQVNKYNKAADSCYTAVFLSNFAHAISCSSMRRQGLRRLPCHKIKQYTHTRKNVKFSWFSRLNPIGHTQLAYNKRADVGGYACLGWQG